MSSDTIQKQYAVIGDPISHSQSPSMHRAAFKKLGIQADYNAVQVHPDHLSLFLEEARVRYSGLNVTIPHKHAVIPFLDEISKQAKRSGSVNTIAVRNGKLIGETTDAIGLEKALQEVFHLSLRNLRVCMIGAGGAARSVAFHFAASGCTDLHILNRTLPRAEALLTELKNEFPKFSCGCSALDDEKGIQSAMNGVDLVLQCTGVGLIPGTPPPLDSKWIPQSAYLFDIIYSETALQSECKARGIRVSGGLPMLIYQGAESFRFWTGLEAPVDAMKEAVEPK